MQTKKLEHVACIYTTGSHVRRHLRDTLAARFVFLTSRCCFFPPNICPASKKRLSTINIPSSLTTPILSWTGKKPAPPQMTLPDLTLRFGSHVKCQKDAQYIKLLLSYSTSIIAESLRRSQSRALTRRSSQAVNDEARGAAAMGRRWSTSLIHCRWPRSNLERFIARSSCALWIA